MSQPMSYDEAFERLLSYAVCDTGVENVELVDGLGRVLARDVVAGTDVPPADNSQMDGYAVRCADLAEATEAAPVVLPVAQRIAAGSVGTPLAAGTVARIFTGAPIPAGADAVVMQEAVTPQDGERVAFAHAPLPGEWIRRAGEDVRNGTIVLPAGMRLAPQSIGLAAAVGVATLTVRRRVRVGCFFTGDELVRPGQPLPPGGIYDANRPMLVAALRRAGCQVTDLGNVPDTLEATREALAAAAAGNDLIISSGGVSVGEEDHLRPAVQAEGELAMWKVAIKPGKPLAYGRVHRRDTASSTLLAAAALGGVPLTVPRGEAGEAHFIGLPGNPVSAFVTFLLFVRPFVLRMLGVQQAMPRWVTAQAAFDWPKPDDRREFLRVRTRDDGMLELFPHQGSGVLTSTVWGDGLVDNPAGNAIREGDTVRFLPFASLGG